MEERQLKGLIFTVHTKEFQGIFTAAHQLLVKHLSSPGQFFKTLLQLLLMLSTVCYE